MQAYPSRFTSPQPSRSALVQPLTALIARQIERIIRLLRPTFTSVSYALALVLCEVFSGGPHA